MAEKETTNTIGEIFIIVAFAILFAFIVYQFLVPKDEVKAFEQAKALIERVCDPTYQTIDSRDIFLPANNHAENNLFLKYFEIVVANNEIRLAQVKNDKGQKLDCVYDADIQTARLNCPQTTVANARIVSELGTEIFQLQATRSPTSDPDSYTLTIGSDPPEVVRDLCP